MPKGVRRVSYVKGKRGKHAGLLPAAAVRGGEEEEWGEEHSR